VRTEKGVIIAAYKPGRNPRFIALNRKKNWEGWELPKGHLEQDDYRKTVEIELEEEAGISPEQINSIEEADFVVEWSFEDEDGEKVKREYKGFLAEIGGKAYVDTSNNPSDEHADGFFFRKRDVDGLLTYDNQKEFLDKVTERLDQD